MTDTTKSFYGNLVTRKLYSVTLFSQSYNGTEPFKVNEKIVDKATYIKYDSTSKNIELCRPCIIKAYDLKDKLLYKAVQYGDCVVGHYTEYYSNGKVKTIGHYKENESGNWENIFYRGYCRMDGTWTYFDKNEKALYSEIWKDGNFLKQYPEQAKEEIWKIDMIYKNAKVDSLTLTEDQLKDVQFIPKYKNKIKSGTNIVIEIDFSAVNGNIKNQKFSIGNFKTLNLKKFFAENALKSDDKINCYFIISNNGVNISNYWLTVKL